MQGEKNSRKGKQRDKCWKNIIGLKKLKIKIIKKKREKKTEQEREKEGKKRKTPQNCKAQRRGRVYNSRKCDTIYTYTYAPIGKIITVQQK